MTNYLKSPITSITIRPSVVFEFKNDQFEIVVVNIVDDVLITAEKRKENNFILSAKSQYTLGTIGLLPDSVLFNGLQIMQDTDFTIRLHGDSKLESLICIPVESHRRRNLSE